MSQRERARNDKSGALDPGFDRATHPFLKFNRRHWTILKSGKIISKKHIKSILKKEEDRGHFLESAGDIGDPSPSKGFKSVRAAGMDPLS